MQGEVSEKAHGDTTHEALWNCCSTSPGNSKHSRDAEVGLQLPTHSAVAPASGGMPNFPMLVNGYHQMQVPTSLGRHASKVKTRDDDFNSIMSPEMTIVVMASLIKQVQVHQD